MALSEILFRGRRREDVLIELHQCLWRKRPRADRRRSRRPTAAAQVTFAVPFYANVTSKANAARATAARKTNQRSVAAGSLQIPGGGGYTQFYS